MKSRFLGLLPPLHAFVLVLAFCLTQSACSRKSGCPADDVQTKTDAEGLPKASKPSSGLLPPKAYKTSKKN